MEQINKTATFHREHREWISTIDFYQNEMTTFQKELGRVLLHYSDSYSIVEHVKEYEDIFSKKIIQIDRFRRIINLHEKSLKEAENIQEELSGKHQDLSKKITTFFMEFEILKTNFKGFVSKHFHAKS